MSECAEDREFSFEIRKELLRLCEADDNANLYHIGNVSYYAKKHKQLNKKDVFYALIDMITYSSMGDKDKAIRNLHLSDEFLVRCSTFIRWPWHGNDGMELSINLLLEIWKVHFVATKYYLDCGVLEQEVSSPLLELTVNDINVNETILLSAYERREWCKITVTMFQNLSELLNKKMIATADIQREAKGREKVLATAAIQAHADGPQAVVEQLIAEL